MLAGTLLIAVVTVPPTALSTLGAHLMFALLNVCCGRPDVCARDLYPANPWTLWLDYQWTHAYWIPIAWIAIAFVCSPMSCPLFAASAWLLLLASQPVRVWQWSFAQWTFMLLFALTISMVQWTLYPSLVVGVVGLTFMRLCHAAQFVHAAHTLHVLKSSSRPAASLPRAWARSGALAFAVFTLSAMNATLDTRSLRADGLGKASFEAYSTSILLMALIAAALKVAVLFVRSDEFLEQSAEVELESAVGAIEITIPAAAFPTQGPQASGHVVLEVGGLIRTQRGQRETLVDLIREINPGLIVSEAEGPRSYARVRVRIEDEEVTRELIKAIGRQRGRRPNIKVVPGSRTFESPRD